MANIAHTNYYLQIDQYINMLKYFDSLYTLHVTVLHNI